MQVALEGVGKKFQHEWIFRDVTFTFAENRAYALTGPNGSGKSTLLMLLSALTLPSRGTLSYQQGQQPIEHEMVYRHLTLAAPYQELIEEFTLRELLEFHFALKKPVSALTAQSIAQKLRLEKAYDKYIYQFSSGMKQRLKLGLALYSEGQLLLLDEPCTNLDAENTQWYRQEVREALGQRLVVIASNQPHEYDFCDEVVDIMRFK
ncbi:MAG: ATP-binding cassette domain-containing protein [Tunicatimonas sp.]